MAKFDYDDVYDFELKRRRARNEIDGGFETFLGVIALALIAAVVAFFGWLHASIATYTGATAASWIVWSSILSVGLFVGWSVINRRMKRAKAERRHVAEEKLAAARGRERAVEVIRRAKADQPGLLAEYWASEGERVRGEADLLDFEAALELIIRVYGPWTMVALADQGHQRLLEDDVCAVFGVHRGVQMTDSVWALLDDEG